MKPWSIELQPWPFWSQLSDWTADGNPDENRLNNCGPESVAMCLDYLTGVELPADHIHDVALGQGRTGYTDFQELGTFLAHYCETPNETLYSPSMARLLWNEWRFLRSGRPLIGLFSFSAPGASDGHFRPVIGISTHHVITADPWTGRRRVEGHREHFSWSKGLTLGLHRSRSIKG